MFCGETQHTHDPRQVLRASLRARTCEYFIKLKNNIVLIINNFGEVLSARFTYLIWMRVYGNNDKIIYYYMDSGIQRRSACNDIIARSCEQVTGCARVS